MIWWIAGGLVYLGLCFAFWCIVAAGARADRQIEKWPEDDEGA